MPQYARAPVPAALLVAASLVLAGPAEAQDVAAEARPVAEATRMTEDERIRVDGLLDEAAWERAVPITEFRQREPVEGGTPSEPTEIRILYDADALYIGAMLYDSEPDGIVAHQLQRDAGLGSDDRFMWIIDTFRDGRTGYFFETNPAGLMGDGLIGGGGFGLNKRWDGIWELRSRVVDDGWSVEIRIPFATLNFNPALDAWGINFQRTIRRRNEEILWSGWRQNQRLFSPVYAGELRGLDDVSQGVGIEVTPYVLASGNQETAAGTPWDGSAKVGGDLSYSLTPSLRAAVTVNTDFAEVEVDERRVNLTRFPLRFPEQRDFFLEGSGVFSFNWADPFFSRRIGLVQGQEVPIRFGSRLGGQAGRYELGFYQIRTGETLLDRLDEPELSWPAEDFTVGRVRRSLFQQSHVGAIYTRRASSFDPEAPESDLPVRHTVGGDFDFYTSEFLGQYNAQIEGFMVFHTDPEGERDLLERERRARGYRWNFPNDLIRLHSSYRDFGAGWDPAVGFAQRTGFRRHQPTLVIAPRPERWESIRQTEHELRFEYLTDMENRVLLRSFRVSPLRVNFESGDRFSFEVGREYERLDRAFTIHGEGEDAIVIQPGPYHAWSWETGVRTAGRRMLSGNAGVSRSDFWDGDRTELELSGTIRPRRGVSLSADYQRNEVRLEQGDFETNLVRLSWAWNPNPLASITGNVQYDDVSEVVGLFARARWIVRPGSDVFLVWSHNWRNEVARLLDRDFTTLSRGGALKVNYSYRF